MGNRKQTAESNGERKLEKGIADFNKWVTQKDICVRREKVWERNKYEWTNEGYEV